MSNGYLTLNPSTLQYALSYIFPVILKRVAEKQGKQLKVLLYKGQCQLTYGRVFYSDGVQYFPFRKAFHLIGAPVAGMKDILVLGAGIGSIALMLEQLYPDQQRNIHFVDIDDDILSLCRWSMQRCRNTSSVFYNRDAVRFVQETEQQFDLICVDVFDEHIVPQNVLGEAFINQLKKRLNAGGYSVMNIMFRTELQQLGFEHILKKHFPDFRCIATRKNKIYIVQV